MSLSPRQDYDDFINADWKKTHRIAPNSSQLSMFSQLSKKIYKQLCVLCEGDKGVLGHIYAAALAHEANVHQVSPYILNMFAEINGVETLEGFIRLSWKYYQRGVSMFIGISVSPDEKQSRQKVPNIVESGLNLPEKNYYTDKELLKTYKKYIEDLCLLYGQPVDGGKIIDFEIALANLQLDRTQARDVDKTYNKYMSSDLPDFFRLFDLPITYVLVDNPTYLESLPRILGETALETLKHYLIFNVANDYAKYQTRAIRLTHFNFFSKYIEGKQKHSNKKIYALSIVKQFLPDLLQRAYVKRHFSKETGTACLKMVHLIIASLQTAIQRSEWMTGKTKKISLEKLRNMTLHVGAPKRYKSSKGQWAGIPIEQCDLTELKAARSAWYYGKHILGQFYKPVDKEIWSMATYEANACYNSTKNYIIIPAGIIQMPFFGYPDLASNLGGIGTLIGHELTHGFDDQGRKFNQFGNLDKWWSPTDIEAYELRAAKVKAFYSNLMYQGLPVNGALTLGENIADIGGVTLSLRALQASGKSPDYRAFFKAYAIIWRQLINAKAVRLNNRTNPHAPDKYRINAVLSHIPEFQWTFKVKPGDGMYVKQDRHYSIWN
jgi:putative endopeptidase